MFFEPILSPFPIPILTFTKHPVLQITDADCDAKETPDILLAGLVFVPVHNLHVGCPTDKTYLGFPAAVPLCAPAGKAERECDASLQQVALQLHQPSGSCQSRPQPDAADADCNAKEMLKSRP